MAMKTVTISFINRKDKVWQKGKNKGGKYISIGLKTVKAPEVWVNGIGDALNAKWEKGDEVTIDITKTKLDDGRVFYNFKNPSAKDLLADVIERLERLENIIKAGKIIVDGETVHQTTNDSEENLPI